MAVKSGTHLADLSNGPSALSTAVLFDGLARRALWPNKDQRNSHGT